VKPDATPPVASEPRQRTLTSVTPAILDGWSEVLALVGDRLGNGAAGLMSGSVPHEFRGDTLMVGFPSANRVQKDMCEAGGRAEQIAGVLSEYLGRPTRIEFCVLPGPSDAGGDGAKKTIGQKRTEILNDPGVRTVLTAFKATVTGIEED
jgi:hypothetical protein